MSKKEKAKRYILFVISLFFSALGVAVTKHGALGVSPTSSVANVFSIKFVSISLGTWLILWNCILIIGQIIILRKDFKMIQLLQIPLSFLFGYFIDFGMWCVSSITINSYIVQMLFVVTGVIILGFGVALSVIANVIMNSGEAFIKAISDKSGKNFGNIKIGFDICNVILSLILSIILFNGAIIGIREGTVIAAVFTGIVVKFFIKVLNAPLQKMLSVKSVCV
ncbi:DUF6198 family protein [Lachnospiraceae bacterium 46-61]